MGTKINSTTGNIITVQGDGGFGYTVSGLPTDKNYKLYMAFSDENRKLVGEEIYTYTNKMPQVTLTIPSTLTDLLTVPIDEDFKEYYFDFKLCFELKTVDAYIVENSTAFSSGWLSKTDGGAALTPNSTEVYIVKTSGDYLNKSYSWNGEEYEEVFQLVTKYENTLTIGGKDIGDKNIITVYPKGVEGI